MLQSKQITMCCQTNAAKVTSQLMAILSYETDQGLFFLCVKQHMADVAMSHWSKTHFFMFYCNVLMLFFFFVKNPFTCASLFCDCLKFDKLINFHIVFIWDL